MFLTIGKSPWKLEKFDSGLLEIHRPNVFHTKSDRSNHSLYSTFKMDRRLRPRDTDRKVPMRVQTWAPSSWDLEPCSQPATVELCAVWAKCKKSQYIFSTVSLAIVSTSAHLSCVLGDGRIAVVLPLIISRVWWVIWLRCVGDGGDSFGAADMGPRGLGDKSRGRKKEGR